MRQIQAHMRKNFIEKKRNGCVTFCECFSHLFIMILLAWGFSLSKLVTFLDRDHSSIDISIPPPFFARNIQENPNEAINPVRLVRYVDASLRGPLRIPNLETYLSIGTVARNSLGEGDSFPIEIFSSTSYGYRLRNIIYKGGLHFAPDSPATKSLIEHMRANAPTIDNGDILVVTHADEDTAIDYILDNPDDTVLALILLHEVSPYKVNYEIRMQYETLPNTNRILRRSALGFGTEYQMYYFSGFFSIQRAVDDWAWQYTGAAPEALVGPPTSPTVAEYVDPTGDDQSLPQQSSSSCGKPDPFLFPFPVPGYTENPFYNRVGFLLGLGLVMATLYPTSRLVKGIVEEKETKLREVMKIMGLRESAHQMSWLLSGMILFLWIACTSTLVTTASFIQRSDRTIMFIYFVLFCLSEVTFSMLLATFFSNSKLASIAAPAMLFSTILPRYIFFNTNDEELWLQKYFTSLLSPSAFAFGADTIARYEYGNLGVQWSNIEDGTYSFGGTLRMMALDFVLYGVLATYFDKVLPNEYGSRLPLLFFIDKKYWFPEIKGGGSPEMQEPRRPPSEGEIVGEGREENEEESKSPVLTCAAGEEEQISRIGHAEDDGEAVPPEVACLPEFGGRERGGEDNVEILDNSLVLRAKVRIRGLRKRYDNGKLALRNLDAALLEGQITCLLGANGAGKSTTIGLLTGLLEASSGDVSVYGHSMLGNLAEIRQLTGICPQQNVIMPTLTVREHLEIFASIKGVHNCPGDRRLEAAVLGAVQEVGLVDKLDTASGALSGGMKRKLCLAIALIGDPKFVLLDEPTSGMDPYSRRSTWEMLLKHKADRVVVLTTHFMEEAENLGDRILIMSDGALRCSGSGLFLKNRYGAGYVLSVAREKEAAETAKENALTVVGDLSVQNDQTAVGTGTDPGLKALSKAVEEMVPGASLSSAAAGEAIFSLPLQATARFADLFSFFEDQAPALGLGVTSYGISITTLEHVFVRLATEAKDADGVERGDPSDDYDEESSFWGRLGAFIRGGFSRSSPSRGHATSVPGAPVAGGTAEVSPDEVSIRPKSPPTPRPLRSLTRVSPAESETESLTIAIPDSDSDNDDFKVVRESAGGEGEESKTDAHGDVGMEMEMQIKIDEALEKLVDEIPANVEEDKAPHHFADGWGLYWIQYMELLRKRLIIASRDFKGLFFQIIFPTMQVVFVLAILMVSYSPAGRTVKLSAMSIDKALSEASPEVVVTPKAGAVSSEALPYFLAKPMQANPYMTILETDTSVPGWPEGQEVRRSEQMSDYLLHTGKLSKEDYDHPFRFGSYIFNDSMALNTTVDWDWVQLNLDYLLENEVTWQPFLTAVGLDLDLSSDAFTSDLADAFFEPITIGNFSVEFDFANNTVTIGDTAVSSRRRLQSLGDLIGNNATVGEVTVGGVALNATAANIILTNFVESIAVNISDAINGTANFTIAFSRADLIRAFIPAGGIEEYQIMVPSPYTVAFNTSSPHGAAAFHGELLSNAFQMCSPLRKYTGGNPGIHGSEAHSIPTPVYLPKNHPLPVSRQQALEIRLILSVLAALFILIPLCYAPAAFVAFLVRERESKSKHLQTISGVSPHLYWLATLTWDVALYTFLATLLICSFFVYGNQSVYVSTSESASATFLLILLYGFSVIPLCYLYSFMFSNHSTAQISIMAINFGTGFIAVLAILIMESLPETQAAARILRNVFRIFPPYLIGEGFINMAYAFYVNLVDLTGTKLSYFDWNVTGRSLTFMSFEALTYFGIVQLSESSVYRKVRAWTRGVNMEKLRAEVEGPKEEEDEDVAKERERLDTSGPGDYSLYVHGLEKAYPPAFVGAKAKYAVRGVSFGLQDGERFGLLGVNGAGKTTTLSMLTGEHDPSAGSLAVGGVSVYHADFVKKLGFCPQVDPLLELMTAYETLFFFGRIRGIPVEVLEQRVESLVKQVGLFKHAHRPCGTYSGGNKRKLSLAVALIGNPRVLLLDEPSTGMDPEARRGMWAAIEKVSTGRSIVLVSHSMEECEALCTRIGIMVSGRLQCLGSSQHIKSRFGAGYQIEARVTTAPVVAKTSAHLEGGESENEKGLLRLDKEEYSVDRVTACLGTVIPAEHLRINEKHGGYIRYSVEAAHVDLAKCFECIEKNKERLGVLDYAISQASLEQIFIQFAAEQEEEKGSRALNGLQDVHEGHTHQGALM